MTLDDRLAIIVIEAVRKGMWSGNAYKEVAQIKQAFADADYIKSQQHTPLEDLPPLMTGLEWFDRFEKELKIETKKSRIDTSAYISIPLEAAKRAAGIKGKG